MAYVNDMSTLADVVGPAYAAQQAGIQNEQANQEQAIKNQVAAGQAPAEIQKPFLANLFQQQQTAAETGTAAQQLAAGNIAQSTQGTAIQAGNAGNLAKMTADQAQKLGSLSQIIGTVAGQMDAVPPPARQAAFQQILQQNGVDPSQLPQEVLSGDPDVLRQVSQKAALASQQYVQGSALEAQKGQVQETVAGTEAGAHVKSSEILAGSREAIAQTNAEVKRQMAPLTAIIGQLTAKAANGTATPQERAILGWAQQSQQLIRSGSPFQAGITGTNVQSNVPPVPGGGGGTSNQPPADQNAFQNAAKQLWPNDDPSKYEYRTLPDGTLQRRAK